MLDNINKIIIEINNIIQFEYFEINLKIII